MDLGFGNSNQVIGDTLSSSILRATQAQSQAIDSELSKYDSLLEANDSELESLREKRLAQLKQAADQRKKWVENGHGVYADLCENAGAQHGGDVAKAFFEAARTSNRMVVHFYRPTTRSCNVFHRALTELAQRHPETRFIKVNVEGCDDIRGGGAGVGAKFLVEKLGIVVMPTLLIVKDRQAYHQIRGFDELGGEDFSTTELAYVLGEHGALTRRDDEEVAPSLTQASNGGLIGRNSLRLECGGKNKSSRPVTYEDFDQK